MKLVFEKSGEKDKVTKGPFESVLVENYVVFGVGPKGNAHVGTYTNGLFEVDAVTYNKMLVVDNA